MRDEYQGARLVPNETLITLLVLAAAAGAAMLAIAWAFFHLVLPHIRFV